MRIGPGIDQLHIHSDFVAGHLHRALQDAGNTELLRDRLQVLRLALVLRGRRARNDLKSTNRCQLRQNLILNALGKISARLVFTQVVEGQHCDAFLRNYRGL